MLSKIIKENPECKEFLKADGFDEAIIGVDKSVSKSEPKLRYSMKKCLEILMKDMDYEEALEFFDFIIIAALIKNTIKTYRFSIEFAPKPTRNCSFDKESIEKLNIAFRTLKALSQSFALKKIHVTFKKLKVSNQDKKVGSLVFV